MINAPFNNNHTETTGDIAAVAKNATVRFISNNLSLPHR
jgi:hypothetical protein